MVDWPTFTLPPINLYNAPRAPSTTAVSHRLATRSGVAPAVAQLLQLRHQVPAPLGQVDAR